MIYNFHEMKNYDQENRKRIRIVASAALFFVLAATTGFLSLISIATLADVNTSVSYVREYGYSEYYYNGEKVGRYQYQTIMENTLYDEFFNSENYDEDKGAYFDSETNGYISYEEFLEIRGRQLTKTMGTYKPISNLSKVEIPDGFVIVDVVPDFTFDENLYDRYMGVLWTILLASVAICSISILLVFMFCGQKDEKGNIKLVWFDKLLGEIQFVIAFAMALLAIPIVNLFTHWLTGSDWGKTQILSLFPKAIWSDINPWLYYWFSNSYDSNYFQALFQPAWVILVLAIVLALIISTFILLIATSLVKKIKARCFWKHTIAGKIIYWANENIVGSVGIAIKIIGSLFLSIAFWTVITIVLFQYHVGYAPLDIILSIAAAFVVLTLVLVPRQIKKYNMVKQGLEEVQKGNFSYKVSGVGNGELGRLAEMVNSITEAQSTAIQNELRGQRFKAELISNVSHDIRTPLTSMVSYVDLLKTEGLTGEHAQEYLDIISDKTHRLQKLTDDLFEAAKASSGDIPVNIEEIDLDAMINQAIAELDENMSANNIELIYTNNLKNSTVLADGNLLWRVIENLLTNVSKYALNGTRAYLDVIDLGNTIALEVKNISNHALNISADELMERFQRGDDSRNTDGSGLGLTIINDLTSLMNGHFKLHIDGDLFKSTVELSKPPLS